VSGFGRVVSLCVLYIRGPPATRVIARARPLDLDHFGAEVGEDLRRERPRQHARQIQNSNSFQRTAHCVYPSNIQDETNLATEATEKGEDQPVTSVPSVANFLAQVCSVGRGPGHLYDRAP